MEIGTRLNAVGLESGASSLASTPSSSATRGGGREGGREGGVAMPLLRKGCLWKRGTVREGGREGGREGEEGRRKESVRKRSSSTNVLSYFQ
jgi:hypothetical protein